jgi:hypothetical protein
MRRIQGSNLLLAPGLVVLLFATAVQAKEKIVHDAARETSELSP